jgi:hypothetical protein
MGVCPLWGVSPVGGMPPVGVSPLVGGMSDGSAEECWLSEVEGQRLPNDTGRRH